MFFKSIYRIIFTIFKHNNSCLNVEYKYLCTIKYIFVYTKRGHIKTAAYILLFTMVGYIFVNYSHRHEHECCSVNNSSTITEDCYVCDILLISFETSTDTYVPYSQIEIIDTRQETYFESLYEIEISVNHLRGPPVYS